MDKKLSIKIPQQSILYLTICLCGVLLFIFAGIIPYQRSLAKLDEKIGNIRSDIADQEELYPLYVSLTKKPAKRGGSALPMPQKEVLPRGQMGKIPSVIREIAARAGMNVTSVSPDISTLTGNSNTIPVTVVLRGEFLKYRKFLLGLGAISSVDRIEDIQIQQNPDALEFRTKIWFALG